MGWFKTKAKQIDSPKQRLINQFVEEYARLKSTINDYEELFKTVSAEREELVFAQAVNVAQTDILDNTSYRMLSFGDIQEQITTVNATYEKFSQPMADHDAQVVRAEAFDYRHAYDSLPAMMRDYITEAAFEDYADTVEVFADYSGYGTYYSTYAATLQPKDDTPDTNPFRRQRAFLSLSGEYTAKHLAERHAEEGISVYFEKLGEHVTNDNYRSPKFTRDWACDIGTSTYHSKERGNWAAGVAFNTLNQTRLKQLGTLDSIIDDGIHHIQNMINEIEEHRIPAQAALDYLQAIHRQQGEDRDLEGVDEEAQERQAMLDKMYNV